MEEAFSFSGGPRTKALVVYSAEQIEDGLYEYKIYDYSIMNFKLVTTSKFNVGDTLVIVKK